MTAPIHTQPPAESVIGLAAVTEPTTKLYAAHMPTGKTVDDGAGRSAGAARQAFLLATTNSAKSWQQAGGAVLGSCVGRWISRRRSPLGPGRERDRREARQPAEQV